MKRVIAVLLFVILLCCVFSACGTSGIILTEKTEHTYLLKYKFKETSVIFELKAHHYDKETGEENIYVNYSPISFSNNFSPNWLVPKGNEITFLVGQIGEVLSNCDTTNYRVKIVLEYMLLKDFENLLDETETPQTYTVEYWLN